jgi:carbonic anhydrase
MLRSIFRRIFVSVREAANGLKEVWGPEARLMPGYREALIEIAVTLNAAQAAYDLRLEVERAGKWEIEVFYGIYNTSNHRVTMRFDPLLPNQSEGIHLAHAPTNPRDFATLALQIAKMLKPTVGSNGPVQHDSVGMPVPVPAARNPEPGPE